MNKSLIKEQKKLLKQGCDTLTIYTALKKIDDNLALKEYTKWKQIL